MAHSTANTFHTSNIVEETIPLSPRQPKPPTHISRSDTGTTSQTKPFGWHTLRRAATLMVQPENTIAPAPNAWKSIQAIIFASCEDINFV
jgi:Ca2+:H+ antiporter